MTFEEIRAKAIAGGSAPEQAPVEIRSVLMRFSRFDAGAGPRHGLLEDGSLIDRDDVKDAIRWRRSGSLRPYSAQGPDHRPLQLRARSHRQGARAFEAPQLQYFFDGAGSPGGRIPDDDVQHAARLEPAQAKRRAGVVLMADSAAAHVPKNHAHEVDRRLHHLQRRLRARPTGAYADDDDGRVVQHSRAARPLACDGRRARRLPRPAAQDLRRRRIRQDSDTAR